MKNVSRFKPEYVTSSLIVIVSIILLLTLFTGTTSIKEIMTYSLIIVLLSFLTADIRKNSNSRKSPAAAYKYVLVIFLFSFLTIF
ncbi:hypothetical protein JOC75_000616 [Metabacillus crassostreae]|uniref:hypothetical protein n=1 Tax=Metabacillus crassostreae TaxID=929098 RepID=UPI001957C767|nr:hypothetical protein [Metabacillus crassostreae]MBM7602646.1 hypothetical protein [Metabacillus crassostreae]